MSKVIRRTSEPGEYERWETPIMEELNKLGTGSSPGEDSKNKGPLTALQLERIQQQAYQEAYQVGLKKGFHEGLKKGTQQAQKTVETINTIFESLAKPLSQLDEQVQQQLVRLTMIITQQLFRREIKLNPGEIVGVVREAVDKLPMDNGNVQLILHPDDALQIADVLKTNDSNEQWKIIEDPSITRGGCLVNTEYSNIDATVEKRLVSIITNMLGGERSVDLGE